ncbi:hypothetical protein WJX81_004263 [Elliptochloris bilobata]|uniref:Uncharacterized protein n=1 Tax=Elliptochloris bilobata TaxID=381761 RepID=A0AAW1RX41_9CHLO
MSGPGSVSNQVGSGYLEDWQIIGVVGHQDLRAEKCVRGVDRGMAGPSARSSWLLLQGLATTGPAAPAGRTCRPR